MNLESFLPSGWKFRQWQTEFLTRFIDVVEQQISQPDATRKAFILDAFPGSGKTLAQLVAMKYLREKDLIDFIVVTVPSTKLKKDFSDLALEMMNLDLYGGKNIAKCHPMTHDGVVLTYHQLAVRSTEAILNDWCQRYRTFVSADEMHHLSDGKSWGDAFSRAFESSKVRLMTSGTPFRTDRTAIPWAEYRHDKLLIKPPWGYRFGYKEALAAGDVRSVIFHPWDGVVSWASEIESDLVEFEHKLTDNLDQIYGDMYPPGLINRLKAERRHACIDCNSETNPRGTDYVRKQIESANQRLLEIRDNGHPYAGGLIIAKDIKHAQAIQQIVREITGEEPVSVNSLSDADNKKLRNFQRDTSTSRSKWLISVQKVTEGIDIKHLRVCVYLTHKTAPLLWTQILGRILRKEEGIPGNQTSHFFQYDDGIDNVPDDDDPNLIEERSVRIREYSESITQQRDSILKTPGPSGPPRLCPVCQDSTSDRFIGSCPGMGVFPCPRTPANEFVVVGATGFQEDQIYGDKRVNVEELEFYRPLALKWHEPEVVCKEKLELMEMMKAGSTEVFMSWLRDIHANKV